MRPSALTQKPGTGRVDLGLAKIHVEISRDDVASTIVALLRKPELNRLILEMTGGDVPDAVEALCRIMSVTGSVLTRR